MKNLEAIKKLDLSKPLTHWRQFYDSNLAIQAIWTKGSFCQLLKTQRGFFGDTVATLRSGTYLTEQFPDQLSQWLSKKRPNNLSTRKAG